MAGRKSALAALAMMALGAAALAAAGGWTFLGAETAAAGCSGCDARHQNLARTRAVLAEETAP